MSKINNQAAARLTSAPGGSYLLKIFEGMEAQMAVFQSEGQFSQLQFVGDPTELEVGDLIPELHFSLRRYTGPILSEQMEVVEGDD